MKICVAGLWHLGTVTAACLAAAGHDVVGYDEDERTVEGLKDGRPPVFEPGLEELVREGLHHGSLRFTAQADAAAREADVVLVAWDTPVGDDDQADAAAVLSRVEPILQRAREGTLVIVSSQLPVGSTAHLERRCRDLRPDAGISFAYAPENLRLGSAIDAFRQPARIVAGVRCTEDRERIARVFKPFTERFEWMSVESAELTKHALNAFLASSVAFANEIAAIAEQVGADAADVARGLKTDPRIGPGAYLAPGASFSGGTLARDVVFLRDRAAAIGVPLRLLPAVLESNEAHRQWAVRRLETLLGDVAGRTVAVWGLTYKPGTDTLRRSDAVALCRTLGARRVRMRAYDPVVAALPPDLDGIAALVPSPLDAARGSDAVVVGTAWPELRKVSADELVQAGAPLVLDPSRFLEPTLGADRRLRYVTVGSPAR